MPEQQKEDSALSVARARFIDSLPAKAEELQETVHLFSSNPNDPKHRDSLKRKLHALFASAEVFGLESLSTHVRAALDRLEKGPTPGSQMGATPRSMGQELERLATAITELAFDKNTGLTQALNQDPPATAGPKPKEERPAESRSLAKFGAAAAGAKPHQEPAASPKAAPVYKPIITDTQPLARNPENVTAQVGNGPSAESQTQEPSIGDAPLEALGDVTVEELVNRLTKELRLGLLDTNLEGKNLRVPMGHGAETMAVAWAAISRLRAQVTEHSGGRVRFADVPHRGGPALVTPSDDATVHSSSSSVKLSGRTIVVVDDDPAVLWFFTGLLRGEGAVVEEAGSGREALKLIRKKRADVIISDILMPGLDGFAFCRELKQDPYLAEIPVILLSWKDDYLQRMRELHAGASGYLRKEAGSAHILSKIQEVLRPKAKLETDMRDMLKVQGEFDGTQGLGIVTLLETVAKERPQAQLSITDSWNVFELTFRNQQLIDISRTASDGTFSRGEPALIQCVATTSGRYTVVNSASHIRPSFQVPFEELLAKATRRLGALLQAVSGTAMFQAYKVVLDEDVVLAHLKASPGSTRALIERLRSGEGPRLLLLNGEVSPEILETVLRDLARRGAIREVRGPSGEDRIAAAMRNLSEDYGEVTVRRLSITAAAATAQGPMAPPQLTVNVPKNTNRPGASVVTDDATHADQLLSEVRNVSAERQRTSSLSMPFASEEDRVIETALRPIESKPPREHSVSLEEISEIDSPIPPRELLPDTPRNVTRHTAPPPTGPIANGSPSRSASQLIKLSELSQTDLAEEPTRATESTQAHRRLSQIPARSSSTDFSYRPSMEESSLGSIAAGIQNPSSARSWVRWLTWISLLFALGFVGYFAWPTSEQTPEAKKAPSLPPTTTTNVVAKPDIQTSEPPVETTGTTENSEETVPAVSFVQPTFGSSEPSIQPEDKHWTSHPNQGILHITWNRPVTGLFIDDARVDRFQRAWAINEGIHQITFERGSEVSYRFVRVRKGHTHTIPSP